MLKNTTPVIVSLLITLTVMAHSPIASVIILTPLESETFSYDFGRLFILSTEKNSDNLLRVSTQWETEQMIDLSSKEAKDNFARTFFRLLEPNTTIEQVTYSYKLFRGYTKPETFSFSFEDSISIRELWQKDFFISFVKKTQNSEALDLILTLRGWKDSLYEAVYDDPALENRSLYKLPLRLIPGNNWIYFSLSGKRSEAVSYTTTLVSDSKPVADRPARFHNSPAEQNCTSCHEGLPGADNGQTMTADCAACHKETYSAVYLHAPAEMKECRSCHEWSGEQHAVVTTVSAPELCYTCHSEKKIQVEESATPHAVAGDCLTCHSPHGSDHRSMVKNTVYSLCIGCHEQYTINHPVGRHPVRFALIKDGAEEISCVSCHNPHGSEHVKLLNAPGGRMATCEQCH